MDHHLHSAAPGSHKALGYPSSCKVWTQHKVPTINQAMGVGGSCEGAKQSPWWAECRCFMVFNIECMLQLSERLNTLQTCEGGWGKSYKSCRTPCWNKSTSVKCKLVWKEHAILPSTSRDLTSTFKYFEMLSDPPGAKPSSLRLSKIILRCFCKHLKLSRFIQDDTRLDLDNSQILELLGHLCRSVGDCKVIWDG